MAGETYILDAVRTRTGKYGGGLAGVRPDDLAATVVRALVERSPELDPERIGDVFFGNSNGAGEENRDVARMAVLLAGLPTSVPGATVNRLCGSGMEAAVEANRAIGMGDASVCIAGGVESMSRAPYVMLKPEKPFDRGDQQLHSTTLGWRLVNPNMPEGYTTSLGEGAEILADKYSVSREAQDEYAVRSHKRAAAAWEEGRFDDEAVDVPDTELERDETIRSDSSMESLAKLRPAFRKDGSVTPGNASGINDGAAAVVVASADAAKKAGLTPIARFVSGGVCGVDPDIMGIGPAPSSRQALERAGLKVQDMDLVEINEAFATQYLAVEKDLGLDREKTNVNGGAIALGHPLGASGARLALTLAYELRKRDKRYGLASLCIGGGQGIAAVIERV